MKKSLLILSFLASQLLAVECTEEQYKPYFNDTKEIRYMYSYTQTVDKSDIVIDKKSIVYDKANQKIKCWTVSQIKRNPNFAILQINSEYDLKTNKVRSLKTVAYDCVGQTLGSISVDEWEDISPESGAEWVLNSLKKHLNIK